MTRGASRMLGAFLLALLMACGTGAGSNDRGSVPEVTERDITFSTADELALAGRLFGDGRVGIVLAHMYPSDATSWYDPARRIAAAGYMALAFNFRGYGGSEGERSPSRTAADVLAAAAALREHGARDVAFVGASMGGTASIIAAASDDPLAVITISAPTNFMGLDAPAAAVDVRRPVLLIASRGDEGAFNAVQSLERALPNPDTKVYEGDAHGTSLLNDRPEAIEEMLRFLRRYAPPTEQVPTAEPAS